MLTIQYSYLTLSIVYAEQIAQIARRYRVFYQKSVDEASTEYLMDHSNFIYLMGQKGEFLTMFRGGTSAETIAKTMLKFITNR